MQSETNHMTYWKLGLAMLAGVLLAGTAASMYAAVRLGSPVVDTDYYNHGLHYGRTGKGDADPGLGWSMSAKLAGGQLEVKVKDRSGVAVQGGELRFESRLAGGAVGPVLAFAQSAPGIFRVTRPVSRAGELRGVLRFTRGEATASQKLILFD
jgi:hypothetical protein